MNKGIQIWPAARADNRAAILMYHRVADLVDDPTELCVSPETFRAHMELIARSYTPLALNDLRHVVVANKIPAGAVAITLDDGYADALVASDILSDLSLPATFFVNSNPGCETFHDALARTFCGPHRLPSELAMCIAGREVAVRCGNDIQARHSAYREIHAFGWMLGHEHRRDLVRKLHEWSGVDSAPRNSHRTLTESEVRELAKRPRHEIGAHTTNHLFLPAQTRSVKTEEITTNRHYLEGLVGRRIRAFAYPYGAADADTVAICRNINFETAVAVESRFVNAHSDPMLLPRIEVNRQSGNPFELAADPLDVRTRTG
jgi:peptidoglycan/xylan/chitin deacetylase (PgdA/CDA1 family)